MRTVIASALACLALLVAPGVCQAASGSTGTAAGGSDLPLTQPASMTVPPPGFTSTGLAATHAAEATATMQALHRRMHPLVVATDLWAGSYWAIQFSYHGKLVAEADLTPAARVTHVWTGPLVVAPWARGHYAPAFDPIWVVGLFSLAFLLVFLDPRRLRSLAHLDALAVLSLLISYWLFDHLHLEAAVWAVYPPLLYLLARMAWVGLRGRRARERLAPLFSTRALAVGLMILMAARIVLTFTSHTVIDVGIASAVGAARIDHGLPIYWAGALHGDTYGPIAYLAYVPFEWILGWHGAASNVQAARVAPIVFDLITVAALVRLGMQLRAGAQGRRLGLALGWAWAACPFTLLGLVMHTNDGLIAMLTVLALVAYSSAAASGVLIGLAAAAKFSPAALLPLFAGPRERGPKGMLIATGAFVMVVVVAIGLYLPAGGLSEFYNHTLGFQLTRTDVFSPWALHPGLSPIKDVLEAGAILLAATVAFVPRRRSMVQICALAAAVTIAVQLPAIHWFYYYVIWFAPFLFVAQLAGASEQRAEVEALEPTIRDAPAPEPALVVA